MKVMTRVMALLIILSVAFVFSTPALAAMDHGMKKCGAAMDGSGGKHSGGLGWKATLTDSQKGKIDMLHLGLSREMSTLKAELMLRLAELNGLVTEETPDTGAVNKKIKEVAALKERMMKAKYSHIMDMRKVLTPAQRVSFDLGLVSGAAHGGGRKGGPHGQMKMMH